MRSDREQHVSDDILRFAEWAASLKPSTIRMMIVALIFSDVLRTILMILHSYATMKGIGP